MPEENLVCRKDEQRPDMTPSTTETLNLNWPDATVNPDPALSLVNWENLMHYAIRVKEQRDGGSGTTCQLSPQYNMGGRNLVRWLDFQNGPRWVARIQVPKHTPEALERLECEVHTMAVARELSEIPVPEVYACELDCSVAGAPFMLMEFIAGDTAMDSFGGYDVHKGEIPQEFQAKALAVMADVQVYIHIYHLQILRPSFPSFSYREADPWGNRILGADVRHSLPQNRRHHEMSKRGLRSRTNSQHRRPLRLSRPVLRRAGPQDQVSVSGKFHTQENPSRPCRGGPAVDTLPTREVGGVCAEVPLQRGSVPSFPH